MARTCNGSGARLLRRAALLAAGILVSLPAVVVPGMVSAQAGPPAEWPMFGFGPARVNFNPIETTLGVSNVSGLTTAWDKHLPAAFTYSIASPVVYRTTAYIAGANIAAVSTITGHIKWSIATGTQIDGAPAVDSGRVITNSEDDYVRSYDATTGSLQWQTFMGVSENIAFEAASPAVKNGVVYVVFGRYGDTFGVAALNETTGGVIWTHTFTGADYDAAPAVTPSLVAVGFTDGTVVGLNPATGATLWTAATQPTDVVGIAIEGTRTYVAEACHLVALNSSTGAQLFSFETAPMASCQSYGAASAPAVAYGDVYVTIQLTSGTQRGESVLYAINGTSGAEVWSSAPGSDYSPQLANGVVFTPSGAGGVDAYNALDGTALASIPSAGEYTEVAIAIAGGQIVYQYTHGSHGAEGMRVFHL